MEPLAQVLRSRGATVHTPTLHRGSLASDTGAVQAIVDASPAPPIVLGHSYGGAVITGLTGIRTLVYLAAFVPTTGESCASLGGALVNDVMQRHPAGGTVIDPELAGAALYADAQPQTAAWAIGLLLPQASGHGRGIPEREAWQSTRSRYIVCTQDRAVDPEVQRMLAQRCSTMVELDADHSPYISQPDVIAGIVLAELSFS
ncbi:alpha/beta hydrolase [Microbacterium sp. CGR2]|nr:alpha/beta hydrolase [Microbacterium sp. CGR2]